MTPSYMETLFCTFTLCAQDYPIGHKYVLSEVAIFPNDYSRHDMAKMPNFGSFADFGAFVYDSGGVGGHWGIGKA